MKEGSLGQSTRKSFDQKCYEISEVSQRKWEIAASMRHAQPPAFAGMNIPL